MKTDDELRLGALTQSLLRQAREDETFATAVVMAAACVKAADAFGSGDRADPGDELERLLGGFRTAAREALAMILQRDGAAA